jgi:hypothetical protein
MNDMLKGSAQRVQTILQQNGLTAKVVECRVFV